MGKFKQFDDYESSTRICPCGDSITWSGIDPSLVVWMSVHSEHVTDPIIDAVVTDDGHRAGG